jgi:hypothetical protein
MIAAPGRSGRLRAVPTGCNNAGPDELTPEWPMARRPKPADPSGRWVTAAPNWLTAIAAVAGVVVTAALGVAGLDRPTAAPSEVAQTSVAPSTLVVPASPVASQLASTAPAANGGAGPGASETAPVVSISSFGWDGAVLRVDGTVGNIRGPLWLAVQPATSAPDKDWRATQMNFELGDNWNSPRPFDARFRDAIRAARYHIKVFQDGIGFGAGGAPGPSFRDELENGGAAKPSGILDAVVDAQP